MGESGGGRGPVSHNKQHILWISRTKSLVGRERWAVEGRAAIGVVVILHPHGPDGQRNVGEGLGQLHAHAQLWEVTLYRWPARAQQRNSFNAR